MEESRGNQRQYSAKATGGPVLILGRGRNVAFLHRIQTDTVEPTHVPILRVAGDCSPPYLKRPGREADHPFQSMVFVA
jgi:hypothetical protein